MSNPNNNPYDSTGNSGNYGDNQQPYGEQPSGDSYGAGDYGSGSGLPSYGSGAQQGPAGSQPGGYQQGAGGYQEPNFGSYEQYQGYQGGGFDDAPVKKSGLALALSSSVLSPCWPLSPAFPSSQASLASSLRLSLWWSTVRSQRKPAAPGCLSSA